MIRRIALLGSLALATTSLGGCSIVNSTIARAVVIAQCDGGADAGYKNVIAACTSILNSKSATDAMRFTALLHRGQARAGLHEYGQAELDLSFALALQPRDEQTLHALSSVQLLQGDRKGALASASRAIHDHPTAENFAARGEVYDYIKDYDPAIADFTRAIALDPKNAEPYNDRCWSRAKSGKQLDLALADCNVALQITPDSPAILNSRGYVFYRLGQYPSAIADLNASMDGYPDFASSLYIRGLVEKRIDDGPDAAKDIKKATALDPAVAKSVVP